MGYRYDVSVIVTYYNQDLGALGFTLASILGQNGVTFEVIVADDCSEEDPTDFVCSFLEGFGFGDFKVSRCPENRQTVGNILAALGIAEGEYVKTIGTGDALYEVDTLRDIVSDMRETGSDVGFGGCVFFDEEPSGLAAGDFLAPTNVKDYRADRPLGNDVLLRNQLISADWIPGGAQFFRTDLMKRLLGSLRDDFGVRYCEDFAATLALLSERIKVLGTGRRVVWYEWGVGISAGSSKSAVKRLYDDHLNFYREMAKRRPYGKSALLPLFLFRVRRFAALRTPLYGILRSRTAKSRYGVGSSDAGVPVNDFFKKCRALADECHGSL